MSRAWLEDRLKKVVAEIAAGKSLTAGNAGETGFEKQLDPNLDAITRRNLLMHDLNVLAPAEYPLEDVAPVTRTRVIWA